MGESGRSFEEEIGRVRKSGIVGGPGRLSELFDFLAARGPGADPATQADIAEFVFGQAEAEADDATARVYIHRLRKRLDQFYDRADPSAARLVLPAGSYALRFESGEGEPAAVRGRRFRQFGLGLPVLVVLAMLAAFVAGRELRAGPAEPEVNAIWRPFLESDRPIMIAVGDYYIFGELNPFDPERSRLIRDFAIDSPTDLARAQEADPARYERAEDMGLNYLPFSSAYALRSLMPVLAQHPKPIGVMPASQVNSDTFHDYNVVYVGLVSGMGLVEDVNFMSSGFAVGENYDELVDVRTGRRYVSGEALSLATPNYYRDYGYIARFSEPGGALVAVVAGERDTGLRGLAPLAVAADLPARLRERAEADQSFEALYEITGQQGADLDEKLVAARARE
jgi:hypothetical protein